MNNIDWTIHCVTDTYKNNPLISNMVNFHTHGLTKHNLTELSVVTLLDVYSAEKVTKMINTVASMMIDGEDFIDSYPFGATHYIDNPDGTNAFKFKLLPTTCYGEETLRMILPDRNGEFFNPYNEDQTLDPIEFSLQETTLFKIEEKSYMKAEM